MSWSWRWRPQVKPTVSSIQRFSPSSNSSVMTATSPLSRPTRMLSVPSRWTWRDRCHRGWRSRGVDPHGRGHRFGRWRDIELDRARRRIRLPDGARLDLGGIAKGWAADRALDLFFVPFTNVIVSVGGDMRVRGGAQAGACWAIGVGGASGWPGARGASTRRSSRSGAAGMATSGATDRWWYVMASDNTTSSIRGRQTRPSVDRRGRCARRWSAFDRGGHRVGADRDPCRGGGESGAAARLPGCAHPGGSGMADGPIRDVKAPSRMTGWPLCWCWERARSCVRRICAIIWSCWRRVETYG